MPHMREVFNAFDLISNPEGFFGRKTFSGLFRGRVEDIYDPEQRGRIKVRIHGVHPDKSSVPVDHLPWAEPAYGDGGANYGDFHVPYRLGDWTYVMFINGHPDYPVWFGGWYGETPDSKVPESPEEVRNTQYPHRRIIKTRRGHKIELSDELGDLEIKITDAKGNFIWLDTETDKLKIYWNGDKEEIITGNYTLNVKKDFKVKVTGNKSEDVTKSRSSNVGETETVGVGQNMYHYTGGMIYHNQGGSAEVLSALPDPRYVVQERKPAFPCRTASLPKIASACGCPESRLNKTIACCSALAAKSNTPMESITEGIESVCSALVPAKDAQDTPTRCAGAASSCSSALSNTGNARSNLNKAVVELQKLQKNGAPVSSALMSQARSTLGSCNDLYGNIDVMSTDITSLQGYLSLPQPDMYNGDLLAESIKKQQAMNLVQTDELTSNLQMLKTDLASVQRGSEINISNGRIQTQSTRYSIAKVESLVEDSLTDVGSARSDLVSVGTDITYCSDVVQEENNRLLNCLNYMNGSFIEVSKAGVSSISPFYEMFRLILDPLEEATIPALFSYLQTALTVPDAASVRNIAVEEPHTVMAAVSGIMNAISYNEIDEIGSTIQYGFGPYSDIDTVASTHGFGAPLLSTIASLKAIDFESTRAISNDIPAIGLSPLKDLSDALLAVDAGHMGRVYDLAASVGTSGFSDSVQRIDAMASATVSEAASCAVGRNATPDIVKATADSTANLVAAAGGYPFDDPVMKLPEGTRVVGLIDG